MLVFIACRDPFVLPTQPSLRNASRASRRSFAAGSYSDHMAMLRAFQVCSFSYIILEKENYTTIFILMLVSVSGLAGVTFYWS